MKESKRILKYYELNITYVFLVFFLSATLMSFYPLHSSCDCLKKISIKINAATDETIAKMKSDTEQTSKLK